MKKDEIKKIASNMLENLKQRLSELDVQVDFSEEVISYISDKGFDPLYGARPLRRAIQTEIEDLLSEKILDGSLKKGGRYLCDTDDGKINVIDNG